MSQSNILTKAVTKQDLNENEELEHARFLNEQIQKSKASNLTNMAVKVLKGFLYIYSREAQKITANSRFLVQNLAKFSLGLLNFIAPLIMFFYFYRFYPQIFNSLAADGLVLGSLYAICFYLAGFTLWLTACLVVKLVIFLVGKCFESLSGLSENLK